MNPLRVRPCEGREGTNTQLRDSFRHVTGDPFVSKSHCAITNGTLMDLSKNGTKVNGSRVQKVPNHFSWRVICLFLGTTLVENEVPNRDANGF